MLLWLHGIKLPQILNLICHQIHCIFYSFLLHIQGFLRPQSQMTSVRGWQYSNPETPAAEGIGPYNMWYIPFPLLNCPSGLHLVWTCKLNKLEDDVILITPFPGCGIALQSPKHSPRFFIIPKITKKKKKNQTRLKGTRCRNRVVRSFLGR